MVHSHYLNPPIAYGHFSHLERHYFRVSRTSFSWDLDFILICFPCNFPFLLIHIKENSKIKKSPLMHSPLHLHSTLHLFQHVLLPLFACTPLSRRSFMRHRVFRRPTDTSAVVCWTSRLSMFASMHPLSFCVMLHAKGHMLLECIVNEHWVLVFFGVLHVTSFLAAMHFYLLFSYDSCTSNVTSTYLQILLGSLLCTLRRPLFPSIDLLPLLRSWFIFFVANSWCSGVGSSSLWKTLDVRELIRLLCGELLVE